MDSDAGALIIAPDFDHREIILDNKKTRYLSVM